MLLPGSKTVKGMQNELKKTFSLLSEFLDPLDISLTTLQKRISAV